MGDEPHTGDAEWEQPQLRAYPVRSDEDGRPAVIQKWAERRASSTGGRIGGNYPQTQKSADKQATLIKRFLDGGIEFLGYVKVPQFSKFGDLEVVVQIPYEYKDYAMDLSDALSIPLKFNVELWPDFADEQRAEA